MDNRVNTIAGWALAGGLVAIGLSLATGEYFQATRPATMGYVVDASASAGGAPAVEQPIAFYLAKADPTKGAQVFKKCAACHNADKGGANALGPNLWDVVGEPIGQGKAGFAFSDGLKGKGGNWDWDSLSQWLTSPKTFAPGTKMTFAGLSKAEDRANVIAFLNQHSDAPKPMPAVPAPDAAPAATGDAKPAEGAKPAADAAKPAAAKPAAAPEKK